MEHAVIVHGRRNTGPGSICGHGVRRNAPGIGPGTAGGASASVHAGGRLPCSVRIWVHGLLPCIRWIASITTETMRRKTAAGRHPNSRRGMQVNGGRFKPLGRPTIWANGRVWPGCQSTHSGHALTRGGRRSAQSRRPSRLDDLHSVSRVIAFDRVAIGGKAQVDAALCASGSMMLHIARGKRWGRALRRRSKLCVRTLTASQHRVCLHAHTAMELANWPIVAGSPSPAARVMVPAINACRARPQRS